MYEARGVGPHLWLSATKGLGFHVYTVRIKDEGFVRIHSALGFSPQLMKWGEYCKRHPNLSIIFSYIASIPPLGKAAYWATWLVTHIFFAVTTHAVPPPTGW